LRTATWRILTDEKDKDDDAAADTAVIEDDDAADYGDATGDSLINICYRKDKTSGRQVAVKVISLKLVGCPSTIATACAAAATTTATAADTALDGHHASAGFRPT
jgi:hypothetical protein